MKKRNGSISINKYIVEKRGKEQRKGQTWKARKSILWNYQKKRWKELN